jgi:lysophospholipase L1-like esterase
MKIVFAALLFSSSLVAQVQLGKNVQIGAGSTATFITSLTTTGTSGPASVVSGVLNIPQYAFNFTLGATPITGGSTITAVTGLSVNGVTLNAAGSSTLFLNQAGGYTTPAGGGGGNTTSTALTTNTIPKANGANSIINSGLTDDGTSLSYTGSGTANGISFPASSTPVTPVAATAIYESDSSGNAAISENGAAASRVCTVGNGQCPGGTGVSSVSVVSANGVSGTVANPTTTPAITLTLGAITPTTVASAGAVSTTNGAFNATTTGTGNQIPFDAADSALATGNTSVLEVGLDTGGNDSAMYGFKNVGGTTSALNLGVIGITSGAQTTFNNAGNWTIPGTINGVPLTAAGSSTLFLNQAGGYTAPAGGGSGVQYNPSSTTIAFLGDSRFIEATGCATEPVNITAWSITSNVVTFTATNSLVGGEPLLLSKFGTSTFFNGQIATVLASGLSGTQFKVNFTHANGSATETGLSACGYAWPQTTGTRAFVSGHGTTVTIPIVSAATTITDLISNYTANVHPLSPAVTGNPGFLVIQVGFNDIGNSCTSLAAMKTNFQSLWSTAHADNWTIVQTSVIQGPWNTTFCAQAPSVFASTNDWLRGQAKGSLSATGQFWDKFIDVAQSLSDNTNQTLFKSDNVHLNDGGNSVAADLTNEELALQGSALKAYYNCLPAVNCAELNTTNAFTASQNIIAPNATLFLKDTITGTSQAIIQGGVPYTFLDNLTYFDSIQTVSGNRAKTYPAGAILGWNSVSSGLGVVTTLPDTGLSRAAAGVVAIGNGTAGDTSGTVKAASAFFGGLGSSTSPLCTTTGGQITNSGCVVAPAGPVLRGSGIQASSGTTFTVAWPSGTAAGDLAIIFASSAFYVTTPPAGWTLLDHETTTSNWAGSVFYRYLNSADITATSVPVTFSGAFDASIGIATFVGATIGVRTTQFLQNSTGSTSVTVPSDGSPLVGDYALYWGSNRGASTNTVSLGTMLRQANDGSAASGGLYGGALGAAGGISPVFGFTSAGAGYYNAIVVLKGSM